MKKVNEMKVMIADIDGTLVIKGDSMGPITRRALCILHEHGILLGIASGRVINKMMMERYLDWDLPFQFDVLIGMNGGQIWDRFHEGIHEEYALDTKTMRDVLEWMKPLGLIASVYEGDTMIVTGMDEMQEASASRNRMVFISSDGDLDRLCRQEKHSIIFRFKPEDKQRVTDFMDHYLNEHPDTIYTSVHTAPGIVEIVHKKCSKEVGVLAFARRNNLSADDIVCMGDMDNDIGLVEAAGIGVAMKNGSEATKAAADMITEYAASEDGVGHFLFDHWIIPNGWGEKPATE